MAVEIYVKNNSESAIILTREGRTLLYLLPEGSKAGKDSGPILSSDVLGTSLIGLHADGKVKFYKDSALTEEISTVPEDGSWGQSEIGSATDEAEGTVRLAGDLGGTADAPAVVGLTGGVADSATEGSAEDLPGKPKGYLKVNVNGEEGLVPYF